MTPARFAAIATAAGIFTTAKILCFVFEIAARRDLVPTTCAALVTIAVIVSWNGVLTGLVLNRLDRHAAGNLDRVLARIDAAVEEAGDRRSIQTAVDALRQSDSWPTEARRRPTLV
jgi:hypothetical protein